jgi:hypothetical protein
LPYFLPVEMQASVFALILTAWELEMNRPGDIEGALMGDGLAMHQMRAQWRQDVHLFHPPTKRASFWPNIHPDWLGFDQRGEMGDLPRPSER